MKRLRILLWALVAVAAAGAAFLATRPKAPPTTAPPMVTSTSFGGPFTLTGADGQPFPSSRLNGKPYAIFFGFTHCPDVCPTTLARLTRLRKAIGTGDEPFRIVFVSVDPERDTPAEVGRYAGLFGTPVIGLTGTPASVERVKKLFGIYSQKVGSGPDYSVDHTATVLLFDRAGGFAGTISPDEPEASALGKLKRLVA
ncbi:SCO family protein [Sphingomonas ginkgonis]|uniref:SCO family protein n=1 Tax=Sphingomonas ginkgonis TaxID=2315330 RepID=A0A3R9X9D7_9SPHN|nr:SCO family protein [Sphingomonas ginkgonis]RST31828.1 SCO family protein [Sphingomonas ginkgonis]